MADASLGMMIFMDPPRHDELRRLVSRAFTPRRVTALEARVRELCARVPRSRSATAPASTTSRSFAAKIPTMVIGALLGIPNDDQDQLRKWIDADDAPRDRDGMSAREARGDRQLRRVHARRWSTSGAARRRTTWSPSSSRPSSTRDRRLAPQARPPRGHGVLHAARVRGQRDHRAAARLGGGAARAPSRAARAARRATRRSSRTRSRSCCATSRRRRSRRAS